MNAHHRVRICIPICEKTIDGLKNAAARARREGNALEFRLDCLSDAELKRIDEVLSGTDLPTILTFRPAEQGGYRQLSYDARFEFWTRQQEWPSSYLMDLELDLVENLTATEFDWTRVIGSQHDVTGPPADLEQIYERLARTPVGIIKIAVQARDVTDCIPIFELLDRARADGREVIAIAMGQAGIATRILGPARGSYLTYGSLDSEGATAPGQITAEQLKSVYRIDKLTRERQVMGLVGLPVAHSISPHIHNAAFAAVDFDGVYIPFEVHDVVSFIKRMVDPGTRELDLNIRGLSITAPHKRTVMDQLNWIDPAAQEIGAVNTIVVDAESLRGYNTDGAAFFNTLSRKAGDLRDARCAVIGAGGAASAALWGLKQTGCHVTIFARDVKKAGSLATRFNADVKLLGSTSFDGFDVVVNATPLGTAGAEETETPARAAHLRGARLAYDLVYNPEETQFLREAQDAGCDVLGGLAMLVAQATEQFRMWTGLQAPEKEMQRAAIDALKLSSESSNRKSGTL